MTATLSAPQAAEIVGVTFSGPELARELGIAHSNAVAMLHRLGYPPVGSGHQLRATYVDLLICRSWRAVAGDTNIRNKAYRTLCRHAEHAIRQAPRRWLLVHTAGAETFHTVAELGRAWDAMRPRPVAWVIDLEPGT